MNSVGNWAKYSNLLGGNMRGVARQLVEASAAMVAVEMPASDLFAARKRKGA